MTKSPPSLPIEKEDIHLLQIIEFCPSRFEDSRCESETNPSKDSLFRWITNKSKWPRSAFTLIFPVKLIVKQGFAYLQLDLVVNNSLLSQAFSPSVYFYFRGRSFSSALYFLHFPFSLVKSFGYEQYMPVLRRWKRRC